MATDYLHNYAILFGGCTAGNTANPCPKGEASNQTWTWDGSQWTLRVTDPSSTPPARLGAAMAYDPGTENVLMFGGLNPGTPAGPGGIPPATAASVLGDLWQWNGGSWTKLHDAGFTGQPSPRLWAGMASLSVSGSEHMVLFGGCGAIYADNDHRCSYVDNQTWTYAQGGWTQTCTSSCTPPSARFVGAQMTQEHAGSVLLYGGHYADTSGTLTDYQDTWRWNGTTWTQLTVTGSPGLRHGGGMAKIQHGTTWKTLLYGGATGPTETSPLTNATW